MDKKILTCPYCGSENIKNHRYNPDDHGMCWEDYWTCKNCGKKGFEPRNDGRMIGDWSDVSYKYRIGQTVYMVKSPIANVDIETEPIISEWLINGVGIDENRRPMYHLVPPKNAPMERFLWYCDAFVSEYDLFDYRSACKQKTKMWRENLNRVAEKRSKKFKAWEEQND